MKQYKKDFIDFLVEAQALKFGDFVTKSGRNTPFFINLGCFNDGCQLRRLGEFYADTIYDNFGGDVDVLFGPAYKGIPIATAAAIALDVKYGVKVRYCSNRKEITPRRQRHSAGQQTRRGRQSGDCGRRDHRRHQRL